MSLTVNAASTTLPTITPRSHGHKKGIHADTSTDSSSSSSSASSGETPTSTEGLFSRLLQTVGQVIGIPAITALGQSGPASAASTPAAAASSNAVAQSSASSLGRNVNAKV